MVEERLEEIGFRLGTDKSRIEHEFLDFYQEELRRFSRESPISLIEVGVFNGSSLRMWAEWFRSSKIVGIDINPEAKNLVFGNKVEIIIGDANDASVLDAAVRSSGVPSIIIDDGSHRWHHQVAALQNLWPRLAAGGAFVMEDLHTSFPALTVEYRGDGLISGYDYIQKLNRWVVGNRFMGAERAYDDFIQAQWPTVSSIHWFRGTCVIHKKSGTS